MNCLSVKEVLLILKQSFEKNNYVITSHFQSRCIKREFKLKDIFSSFIENMMGVVPDMIENRYQILLNYRKLYHLVIIIEISNNKIKFITLYPQKKKRSLFKEE